MAQVTVKLLAPVAAALHGRAPLSADAQSVLRTVRQLGLQLTPMHPGVDDPDLASYFSATVADRAAAKRAIEALRQTRQVSAAYLKPAGSPPLS